jgi:hypothetical protein
MNDHEIDNLMAATAPVSDAAVAGWDLAGTETHLCEEIMSQHTVESPHAPADRPAERGDSPEETPAVLPPGRGRRRARPLVLAAAVLAAVAAVGGTVAVRSSEPAGATSLDAALAASSAALDRTGRAEWRYRLEGDESEGGDWVVVDLWAFSGDDLQVEMPVIGGEQQPEPYPVNRRVDGEFYLGVPNADGTGYDWSHDINGDPYAEFGVDPRGLFGGLRGASSFEEVGTEPVDGVETTRLRATEPRDLPNLQIDGNDTTGKVTALDLWVDGEDLVRRLDVTLAGRFGDSVESISIRFYDIGEPITIEAPDHATPIDPVG